ncbi:hypothetical protein CLOM_g2138 [Closterium sp. NIES-68]|nr:hypothetical protein CLOM_g2138 [Closterium sp. NIES-68]GJP70809.1 hypothetical protein CLOP_g1709 [Closterium sp. NIES-67]
MAEGLWRGPSADQDVRFSDKDSQLLRTQRFAKIFDKPVDMKKVKKEVIYPWIARRVTEFLGVEDEVLINFIFSLLQEEKVDPKRMQIQLTGFLENHTTTFMKELWRILRNAHRNEHGIPQKLLDDFAEENGLIPTEVEDARKKALEAAARLSSDLLEDTRKERDVEVQTIGDGHIQRCNRSKAVDMQDKEDWTSPSGRRDVNGQKRKRFSKHYGHRHAYKDRFRPCFNSNRSGSASDFRQQTQWQRNFRRHDCNSPRLSWQHSSRKEDTGRSFRRNNSNQHNSIGRGDEMAFPPGFNFPRRETGCLAEVDVINERKMTFPPGFEKKINADFHVIQDKKPPQSPPSRFECRRARRSPIQARSFKRQLSWRTKPDAHGGMDEHDDEATDAQLFQTMGDASKPTVSTAQAAEYNQHAADDVAHASGDLPPTDAGNTARAAVDTVPTAGDTMYAAYNTALISPSLLTATASGADNASHGEDKVQERPDQQDSSHQVEDMDISSEDESSGKKAVMDSAGSAGEWDGLETREERKARRKERRRLKEEKRARKEERRQRRVEKRLRKEERHAAREARKKMKTEGDIADGWVPLTMMEADALKQDAEIHICSQDFEERDRRWLDTLLLDDPAADTTQPEDPEWESMPKLAAAGSGRKASQEHHKTITADEQRKADLERDLRMKAMQSLQTRRLTQTENLLP